MPDLIDSMAAAAFLGRQELLKIVRSAPKRYKVFQIEKRTPGEYRTIAQPAREVKNLQRWVMCHILNRFPVHEAATGYVSGKNIADNARPHARARFLLKLDFSDFFHSIKARDFGAFVRQCEPSMTPAELEAVSRVLFWQPPGGGELCLSIGAPSSPQLSNVLLWDFDSRVAEVCVRAGARYTRYADDLSFSADSSSVVGSVEYAVRNVCATLISPRLVLNPCKTVRVSKRESRRVTGLILANDGSVSLGHANKRTIRACVHHFAEGKLSADEIKQLRGTLAYVNAVEPSFLARLRQKYGREVIRWIQRA